MPEFKQFMSPKILVPIVSLIVLIVVAVLITVFYVRNPTVTDGIFSSNQDTTPTPYEAAKDGSNSGTVASVSNILPSIDNQTKTHTTHSGNSTESPTDALNASESKSSAQSTNNTLQPDIKDLEDNTISPAPPA